VLRTITPTTIAKHTTAYISTISIFKSFPASRIHAGALVVLESVVQSAQGEY